MVRPFKRFDDLKQEKDVNMYISTFFLFIFGILTIIEFQYKGFIFNDNNKYDLNALTILITSIIPILIAIVANWTITTFIDGKGNMKEIYLTITYSLFPLILTRIISVVLTNFLTLEDQMFSQIALGLGAIWSVYLLFIGLVVIHEFSFAKNFLGIILTIISMCVIIFLILLFFNLIQQLLGFSESFINEIIYRIRGR